MSVNKTEYGTSIYGAYVPSLDYQFLPGCRECGGSHPLARNPAPENITECPDCGAPAGTPGAIKTEGAVFPFTPAILLGQFCLWMGRKLGALYERI